MCCLQEVRWRGQGALFVDIRSRRYELWWSGNRNGIGGVEILVKGELCKKVVEVRRKSDCNGAGFCGGSYKNCMSVCYPGGKIRV